MGAGATSPSKFIEPLFVFVIMALASARPIVSLAGRALGATSRLLGGSPAAHWFTLLTLAPLLGSLITEPAAMTIGAWLLSRQFFVLRPSESLKYATLALLFVNVSVGGALTHFAAPPIVMVAGGWGWGLRMSSDSSGWAPWPRFCSRMDFTSCASVVSSRPCAGHRSLRALSQRFRSG